MEWLLLLLVWLLVAAGWVVTLSWVLPRTRVGRRRARTPGQLRL